MEAILRHSIFRFTIETPDNYIIEMSMASAACGPVMKAVLRYAVLCSAGEAPDNHFIVCHCETQSFVNIIIIRTRKVNILLSDFNKTAEVVYPTYNYASRERDRWIPESMGRTFLGNKKAVSG